MQKYSASKVNSSWFHSMAKAILGVLCYFGVISVSLAEDPLMFVPKSISTQVPPNLTLTFDNSTSMKKAYTPDFITLDTSGKSNLNTRALRSPAINKLYYNPEVTYLPPLNADGTAMPHAKFSGASKTPFFNSIETIDLAKSYAPRWDEFDVNKLYKYPDDPESNKAVSCKSLDQIEADVANKAPLLGLIRRECGTAAYYFKFIENKEGCKSYYPFIPLATGASRADLPPNECFEKVLIDTANAQQRQNFANWYQYYSTRLNAAKSLISYAFKEDVFPSSIRVARQNFTTTDLSKDPIFPFSGPTTNIKDQHVASFDFEEREYFYDWLFNQGNSGYSYSLIPRTRLRQAIYQAGKSYSQPRNASDNPSEFVSPFSNPVSQCRSNYHLLVTDGQWYEPTSWASNSANNAKSKMIRDDKNVSLPDGIDYVASDRNLYRGVYSTKSISENEFTLADVAFHFWSTDLLPDYANKVKKVTTAATGNSTDDYWNRHNNPATWQHMVNLIISFGVSGSLEPSAETEKALADGTKAWPHIHTGNISFSAAEKSEASQAKVDDLYHAAINSRGKYFAADSVSKLQAALKESVEYVTDNMASNTSVAINTSTITSGSAVFQAIYDGENGIGRLKALPLSDGKKDTECNKKPIGTVCDEIWDAAEKSTIHATNFVSNRKVITYSVNKKKPNKSTPVHFSNAGITKKIKNKLAKGYFGVSKFSYLAKDEAEEINSLVNYLRGSDSHEDFLFPPRHASRLGPIVNSDPLYVSNGVKATGEQERYFDSNLESSSYDDFICSGSLYKNGVIDPNPTCLTGIYNRLPMVYVNSNDGMLHAYNATMGADGGKEVFSYLPNMLIERVAEAAQPGSPLQPMADGPLTNADVFFDGAWNSVLVGGLRSGGKGYYALNVTDPNNFTKETLDSDIVLWEFQHKELGYSYSDAVIVKSNDTSGTNGASGTGRWVAIFGNGYHSKSHKASLFIVDIKTGKLIKHIPTGVGNSITKNGLGTPAVVFNDDGYTADYAYVGDLQGNLWKFDLRSDDPEDWGIAGGKDSLKKPLFKAAPSLLSPQAITAAPLVSAHPSGYPGNMVYVGTGRYLTEDDHSIPASLLLLNGNYDSFYAIWDKDICTGNIQCSSNPDAKILTNHYPIKRSNLTEQEIESQSNITQISGGSRGARYTSNNPVNWQAKSGWHIDFDGSYRGERVISQALVSGLNVYFVTFKPSLSKCDGGGQSWLMALNRANGGPPLLQPFDSNGDNIISTADFDASKGVTSGIELDGISVGLKSIARCGDNLCVYAQVKPEISQDGLFSGRWRWKQLR